MTWHGTARHGTVRYGTVRTVRYGTAQYGTGRDGTGRYGTVRYCLVQCGMHHAVTRRIILHMCYMVSLFIDSTLPCNVHDGPGRENWSVLFQ